MFKEIFLFELRYQLKRPAIYCYLLIPFLIALYAFTTGSVAAGEGQFYNAPAVIARFVTVMSFFLLLIVSAIMGSPLYRDVEYRAASYYLSYPISKAGYFWGRFVGSFVFILLLGALLLIGACAGTLLGPLTGMTTAAHYGPNHLVYYLQPYFAIIIPNLLLPSALFFGLVAVTRNIKVIYSSGVVLLLAYMAARVYFDFTDNADFSQLADPFAYNSIRLMTAGYSPAQLNTALISFNGLFLLNRLIWTASALLVASASYKKFSLNSYFSQKTKKQDQAAPQVIALNIPATTSSYKGSYFRSTLATLTKVELRSIFRDNFFWIIVISCTLFEGFAFWLGTQNYQVRDFPRTVALLNVFKNDFLPYLFVIIIFYTGETIHRERSSRFAVINDALPPTDWLFYAGKLIALLLLSAFMVFTPIVISMLVQLAQGYTDFHLSLYVEAYVQVFLPKALQMVLLAFFIHVIVNHKFGGHLIGIAAWLCFTLLAGYIGVTYNLFLYSTTPFFNFSDMEGAGHMLGSVNKFNLYWLLAGGLLSAAAYLFYQRGLTFNLKGRAATASARVTGKVTGIINILFLLFLLSGGIIYYNISYLNNYQTEDDEDLRQFQYETQLKKYQNFPLPQISTLKLREDLYPETQSAKVIGAITLINPTSRPIDSILLDGEALTAYTISYEGKPLRYKSPLIYAWGTFNWFRKGIDTSRCRVYHLSRTLAPGDSIQLELSSIVAYKGFQNDLYGTELLHNGSFFAGGLPQIGYNPNKELSLKEDREKFHLPIKAVVPDTSSIGEAKKPGLQNIDLTVGTSGDQTIVAPGDLLRHWTASNRNYFHFKSKRPDHYLPLAILSATYAVHQSPMTAIYYLPEHDGNVNRLADALADGIKTFSANYGPEPFTQFKLVETSNYGPYMAAYPGLQTFAEYYGWDANLDRPDQFDYVYFTAARQLAQQWWQFKVTPAGSHSARVIAEGLSTYSAMLLYEKKYGMDPFKKVLKYEIDNYLIPSARDQKHMLLQADKNYDYDAKAAMVLYGLKDLIGESQMNRALRAFTDTFAGKPIRPGSGDLYRFLKRYTPDSLQYFLTDSWEKVSYYNNRMIAASTKPLSHGRYAVTLKVNTGKWYQDANGNIKEATQMTDYIDLSIFGKDVPDKEGNRTSPVLYLKKLKFNRGVHTMTFIVTGKPASAGVDPYYKLIDRNTNDHIITIK